MRSAASSSPTARRSSVPGTPHCPGLRAMPSRAARRGPEERWRTRRAYTQPETAVRACSASADTAPSESLPHGT